MAIPVSTCPSLTADEVVEVLDLLQTASAADGAVPLSEHARLRLRQGADQPGTHLVARVDNGSLAGYAYLDITDTPRGATAELVVHPRYRRHGLGRALARGALTAAAASGAGWLHAWAHGDHPAARALSLSLSFERYRALAQMRRPLTRPALPDPVLPAGVSIRAFVPGQDDEAWTFLNAQAFADHPEQGRWTVADLRLRLAEPWFDRAGFLLAERDADGELVGFHWTKIHGTRPPGHAPGDAPIGEVYVLGVAPSAHGLGLGRALTLAGLRHLRDSGVEQGMLYVDESNTGAAALYRKLGFTPWATDVAYRRRTGDRD